MEPLYASDRFDANLGYRLLYGEHTGNYGFGLGAAGRGPELYARKLRVSVDFRPA
jgi:hypothetical protein